MPTQSSLFPRHPHTQSNHLTLHNHSPTPIISCAYIIHRWSTLLQCTHTFRWVPHSPFPNPYPPYSTCSPPIRGAHHMSALFPVPNSHPTRSALVKARFHSVKTRLHRAPKTNHSPLSTWRGHTGQGTGIQGCFLVYITTSTVSSSLRTQTQTPLRTAREENKPTKWRPTLSSLSSPCSSSSSSAPPPPPTTTTTPFAKASSSSRASARADSPPISASAGAATQHCTTVQRPE